MSFSTLNLGRKTPLSCQSDASAMLDQKCQTSNLHLSNRSQPHRSAMGRFAVSAAAAANVRWARGEKLLVVSRLNPPRAHPSQFGDDLTTGQKHSEANEHGSKTTMHVRRGLRSMSLAGGYGVGVCRGCRLLVSSRWGWRRWRMRFHRVCGGRRVPSRARERERERW